MLHRQIGDGESQARREVRRVALRPIRAKKVHPRTGHEGGADERLRAGLFVVAIDERGTRSYPKECRARAFRRLRKVRRVSGEFNGDTEERGSEWVGGQDQYVGTAHVAMGIGTCVDAL